MAISRLPPSKGGKSSPYRAASNKRKRAQLKKSLSQKMTTGSRYNPTNKEKIDVIEKPIMCYKRASRGSSKKGISAIDRSQEVQARLPPNCPSFVKLMLKSHVTGGFWLGLPRKFCAEHLPMSDAPVFLVDESGKEHETKYLRDKNGLSAGWRGFSIAHNLLEGDVLVFQLLNPSKFKVHIIRVCSLAEIDGAIGLLNLDCQAKSTAANVALIKDEPGSVKNAKMHPDHTSVGGRTVESACNVAASSSDQPAQLSDEDLSLEVLDGIRFSETTVEFKDVKSMDSFSILLDGLVLDAEIPVHLRTKYYQLCCSQNAYLHTNIFKGLNCKLVAGVIAETVNISDAIRAAKITTPMDDLQVWDRTLKSFEDIGMAVGFLRERIKNLLSFQSTEQEMIQSKKNAIALLEEDRKNLQTKLENIKSFIKSVDEGIKILEIQNERHDT